jgi:hypothetical protein
MKSFGQEFYPYEAIRALKFADKTKITDRRALVDHIAASLTQPSEMTRLRVAAKFVQRYFSSTRSAISPPPQAQPFVRLVARNRHTPTQIELLFYRLSQVDGIVGATARELFYPVCVAGRPPEGVSAAEFAARNGAQLLATTPLLTRTFVVDYARTRWDFTNRSTLDRSLRVLQGAGLIARERMTELRGHPTAFRLSDHNVSLVTFLYALYDEFLPHARSNADFMLARDVLPVADFARTLLLSPRQVDEHAEAARRHQLLALHGRQLRLVFGNLDALVDTLLTKAI